MTKHARMLCSLAITATALVTFSLSTTEAYARSGVVRRVAVSHAPHVANRSFVRYKMNPNAANNLRRSKVAGIHRVPPDWKRSHGGLTEGKGHGHDGDKHGHKGHDGDKHGHKGHDGDRHDHKGHDGDKHGHKGHDGDKHGHKGHDGDKHGDKGHGHDKEKGHGHDKDKDKNGGKGHGHDGDKTGDKNGGKGDGKGTVEVRDHRHPRPRGDDQQGAMGGQAGGGQAGGGLGGLLSGMGSGGGAGAPPAAAPGSADAGSPPPAADPANCTSHHSWRNGQRVLIKVCPDV
jgi:hypothetical protein